MMIFTNITVRYYKYYGALRLGVIINDCLF